MASSPRYLHLAQELAHALASEGRGALPIGSNRPAGIYSRFPRMALRPIAAKR